MSDNPDRIYLEPDHAQIEGRMWCQDDDPASLGEPWTEYVRADLFAAVRAQRDKSMAQADKATALASEYLRERDRYRKALEKAHIDMVHWLESWRDEMDQPEDRWCGTEIVEFVRAALGALNREE